MCSSDLKARGYATASVGKWHLGGTNSTPLHHGVDENHGGTARGQPPSYFSPYGIPTLPDGPPREFLTDRESAEALQFIERNRARPFFLYLPHYAVHTPLQGKPDVIEKYRQRIRSDVAQSNAVYAALVESVDDSVGRIVAKLQELRLDESTIVVFTSDNGGLVLGQVTSNAPLRSGKGSAYEGGVRVPMIVRWPSKARAGRVDSTPVMTIDIFPTLAELAGFKPGSGSKWDGRSLADLVLGNPMNRELRTRPLFWHYPHYHPGGAAPYSAILCDGFKIGRAHV